MVKIKYILFFLLINFVDCNSSNRKVTVFVHGTLFPIMNHLVHTYDCPMGLNQANKLENKFIHGRIGYILSSSSKEAFPLEHIYLYGWSGKLSFDAREKTAEELFDILDQFKNDEITLVGHSHGCNVALNLAKIADKKNKNFKIDKLILLAGPVQEETKNLVASSYFKRVYSFFSKADYIQILDPQGLYFKVNRKRKKKNKKIFSQRVYPNSPNLVQSQVLFNGKDPWHVDFILEKFIKFMPGMIEGLESIWSNDLDRMVPLEINIDEDDQLLFIVSRYNPQSGRYKKYNIIQTSQGFCISDLFDN